MALKFTPQRKTIHFTGGEIDVRGLSYPDLAQLVETHRDSATELYERFTGIRKDAITAEEAGSIALEVVTKMPAVAAHIVALAADVPEDFEIVLRLPLDVLASALETTALLSFAMEGGLKNFLETVTRIATGANRLVDDIKSPLG